MSEQEVRCPYCNAILILMPGRQPQKATQRQLDYIRVLCKKAGKDLPPDLDKLTKEEASKLIDELLCLKPEPESKRG